MIYYIIVVLLVTSRSRIAASRSLVVASRASRRSIAVVVVVSRRSLAARRFSSIYANIFTRLLVVLLPSLRLLRVEREVLRPRALRAPRLRGGTGYVVFKGSIDREEGAVSSSVV